MEKYDYAVIGAGPGGYVSAIRAAQLGLKTALIEKDERLGGVCLNVGCIPSKALLESSELYALTKNRLSEHGILVNDATLDLAAMMKRKDEIVRTLTDGIQMLMKKNKITVLQGLGRLTAPKRIQIEGKEVRSEIEASAICLAMGSMPMELPFLKFDGVQVVSSTEALSFDKAPEHLIVIGAGAIGLELGSVWNRLGAKVTVIELLPQIVPFADKQLAILLQRSLKQQGLEILLETKVTGAEIKENKVILTYVDAKGQKSGISGDKVLVAVGRKPRSPDAGLDQVGVKVEPNGRIPVDARFRTNIPGIYAIGDLIHGPMLAHKAHEDGVAVAEIIAGKPGQVNYNVIPNVVYTMPELATVGIHEEQAKERSVDVKVGKFYFRGNGRALTMGETEGMVKVVAEAKTDRILGVHIIGPRASDMIAEAVLAMEFQASTEDLARTIHAHPTLSEALKEAALAVDKRSLHG